MNLGPFAVPKACEESLRALIEKEMRAPYKPAAGVSLPERLITALEFLAEHDLDVDAAFHLFSLVDYWTETDRRNAWKTVYENLKDRCAISGLNPLADAYWLQVRHENHVNEIFVANNLAGRTDPLVQPAARDVMTLWETIKLAESGEYTEGDIRTLRSAAERKLWVLFWDVNLSGKTVAEELPRIARCAHILRPNHATSVHIATQVISPSALHRVREAYGMHRLSGEILTACEVITWRAGVADHMRDRIDALCNEFFTKMLAENPDDKRLRTCGPFGYSDGELIFVQEDNCPNNSVPILWYAPERPSKQSYMGPFVRRWSRAGKVIPPNDLDDLTEQRIAGYARTVRNRLLSRGTGIRTLCIRTIAHPHEDPASNASVLLDLTARFHGRHLNVDSEWLRHIHEPLVAFVRRETKDWDHIRLVLHAHASVAFATGAMLDLKSAIKIDVWQGGPDGACWWAITDALPGDASRTPRFTYDLVREYQKDVALAIGLTHTITDRVRDYIEGKLPQVGVLLTCEPAEGPSQLAVRSGAHAWSTAEKIVDVVRQCRQRYPFADGTVHLFAACPNTVLVFLGRYIRHLGTCQCYEYDLEGNAGYSQSLTIIPMGGDVSASQD